MASQKEWLFPKPLKPGDVVGVIAPSDKVTEKYILEGSKILISWGLRVNLGRHLFDDDLGFAAGIPENRLADISEMLLDDQVAIIWAAYGGYAATQLFPFFDVDFLKSIRSHPKWWIGYSDIGIILNTIFTQRLVSLYGPNLSGLKNWNRASQNWLKHLLFGEIPSHPSFENLVAVSPGKSTGRLLVSNLETVINNFGSRLDPLENGDEDIILAVEQLFEYKSLIARHFDMIMNHKKASRIKGLIIGRFPDLRSDRTYQNWEKVNPVDEIARKSVLRAGRQIPIATTNLFGHLDSKIKSPQVFYALPHGAKVQLFVSTKGSTLTVLDRLNR